MVCEKTSVSGNDVNTITEIIINQYTHNTIWLAILGILAVFIIGVALSNIFIEDTQQKSKNNKWIMYSSITFLIVLAINYHYYTPLPSQPNSSIYNQIDC